MFRQNSLLTELFRKFRLCLNLYTLLLWSLVSEGKKRSCLKIRWTVTLNILMTTLWSAKYPVINKSLLVQGRFFNDILLDVRCNCHKTLITLQNGVYFRHHKDMEKPWKLEESLVLRKMILDFYVKRPIHHDLKTLWSIILISKICDLSHQKGIMAKKQLWI